MCLNDQILFVSAGMLAPKKRNHVLAQRQLYLNYGALSLASLLKRDGYSPALVHGNHTDPELFVDALRQQDRLPTSRPIMLSIPSYFALEWAQLFCRYLKIIFPDIKIVVGGRWVVGADPNWLKQKIPELDLITMGLAEILVHDVADPSRWSNLHFQNEAAYELSDQEGLPPFSLDHSIVDEFRLYQPSIEVSRGCGRGCSFCEERSIKLSKLQLPEVVAQYLEEAVRQYGGNDIRPYFQSSYFVPNPRWALKLYSEIQKRNCAVNWRCQTRVDSLTSETIELLAKSGLKVLDLGMESASPHQLLKMNKTKEPEKYLRQASNVLKSCKANGIFAKINILLYAGETQATVQETTAWLKEHAAYIKGVSVGPVIVFGPPKQALPLIAEMEDAGARIVDAGSSNETGITAIHPSAEIDATAAEEISLSLSRMIMDHRSYYELKSFSYYPRNYTYENFVADAKLSNADSLPFDASALITAD